MADLPPSNPDEVLDIDAVCVLWGGNSPVSKPTIYRQIAEGKHPRPIKIGSLSRWLKSELIAERDRRMAARERGV